MLGSLNALCIPHKAILSLKTRTRSKNKSQSLLQPCVNNAPLERTSSFSLPLPLFPAIWEDLLYFYDFWKYLAVWKTYNTVTVNGLPALIPGYTGSTSSLPDGHGRCGRLCTAAHGAAVTFKENGRGSCCISLCIVACPLFYPVWFMWFPVQWPHYCTLLDTLRI